MNTATHTLHASFGSIAAAFEAGMLACALILCFLAWRDPGSARSVRAWAIGGTAGLLLLAAWTPEVTPLDWTWVRGRWEWTQAIRAGLLLLGCCAVLRSVFLDLPSQRVRTKLQSKDDRVRVRSS